MFFLLIFLISLATGNANYCSPSPDTLRIYPSPKNCSTFIACIDKHEFEYDCISAPLFIQGSETPICVTPCEATVVTKRPASNKAPSKIPKFDDYYEDGALTPVCPFEGNSTAVIFNDCTHYLECVDGYGYVHECSTGQEFSPTLRRCVIKRNSDCSKLKPRPSQHNKCYRDRDYGPPIEFASEDCDRFKRCNGGEAWKVECAEYCHWNNDLKNCDWADNFDCHATNHI